VLLQPELSAGPGQIAAFVLALGLAWALRFLGGYALALLAFWATRADALLAVQDALVFLLAGQVAPVALLPDALRVLATILPFRSMLGFPVEVLTGQVHGPDLLLGFAIQAAWLIGTAVVFRLTWRAGLRHYSAIGG
jgi:ABC-2 type transport system permease protein